MINNQQISETNEKVLRAILEDDNDTIYGVAMVIKGAWNNSTIGELIYFLLNNNKDLGDELLNNWNLKSIIEGK